MCGGVFDKGWADDEAHKEYANKFGKEVSEDDDGVVCDDCYKKMTEQIEPLEIADSYRKMMKSYELTGAAGSKIYVDGDGIVHVDILSPSETLDWLQKINNGESLPDNITIDRLS